MFKQIVVGVDGHVGGRDAIALARNLLAPAGELTFAYVYSRDLVSRDVMPGAEAVEAERARTTPSSRARARARARAASSEAGRR